VHCLSDKKGRLSCHGGNKCSQNEGNLSYNLDWSLF